MNKYYYKNKEVSPKNVAYLTDKGTKLYLDDNGLPLNLNDFTLFDFAAHLSLIKRYNGIGTDVMTHSFWLAKTLDAKYNDPSLSLFALYHDMAETITGDLTWASKHRAGENWKSWQTNIELVMWKFWAPPKLHNKFFLMSQKLKPYDNAFCYLERAEFRENADLTDEPANIIHYLDDLEAIKSRVPAPKPMDFVKYATQLEIKLKEGA